MNAHRLLAASAAVLVVTAAGCSNDRNAAPTPTPCASPQRTATAPAVTATPAPTRTPEPTRTAAPARTPTPTPVRTPVPVTPTEWSTLPTQQRVVALTFDCGSNAAGIAKILSALEAGRAPATFFLTGRWIELFGADASRIASAYPMGNHTYSHPHMTTLSDDAIRAEITRTRDLLRSVTGREPLRLFRFPYGERDDRTLRVVASYGYTSVRWTVDTLGWRGKTNGGSTSAVVDRVLSAVRPGAIVLMHVGSAEDGSTLDADALPRLIDEIRAAGYRIVALTDYL